MQKIFLNLKFPIFILVIIILIYGGLSLADLKNKTTKLQSQNESLSFKTDNLLSKLDQIQSNIEHAKSDIDQAKSDNNNLSGKLATAQKQIAYLQNQNVPKQVLGASTDNIIELKPATITKTITQTVTKEVEKNQATVAIENIGSYKVDLQSGDNAFNVLKRASEINGFSLDYDTYSFGIFIKSIGNINPQGNQYWAFYFNGTFSNVGASDQSVQKGDSVFWQLTSF